MTIRLILLSALLLIFQEKYNPLSAQRFQSMQQAEDTLATILVSLNQAQDDSAKNVFNQAFSGGLLDALKLASSDDYPFDSLKTLVKITSPDHKFRIFQWNLPSGDGKHQYFGFIKILNRMPPLIVPLVNKSDSIPYPDTSILDNLHWFGALYYKIIPGETDSGEKIYTLLGWAGKNPMITQKVIEILRFDDHEGARFGMKIFPDFKEGMMTRIIFRFAATTTMSMKYEKQAISTNKRWNSKKRIFEYDLSERNMIVCDRMVPLDPQLEGQYPFYVAAGDIFDGFLFNAHAWAYFSGIDTRNKK